MNAILLTYAIAIAQVVAENVAKGRETTAQDLADLEQSDAALALARARWQATLPPGGQ